MKEIFCPECEDVDLSLVDYIEVEGGIFEAQFECRQCGATFTAQLSENQLDLYR